MYNPIGSVNTYPQQDPVGFADGEHVIEFDDNTTIKLEGLIYHRFGSTTKLSATLVFYIETVSKTNNY